MRAKSTCNLKRLHQEAKQVSFRLSLLYIGHGLEFYTETLKPDDRSERRRSDKWMTCAEEGGRRESEACAVYLEPLFQYKVWSLSLGVFNTIYNLLLWLLDKSTSSDKQGPQLGVKALSFHGNVFWSRTFNFPTEWKFLLLWLLHSKEHWSLHVASTGSKRVLSNVWKNWAISFGKWPSTEWHDVTSWSGRGWSERLESCQGVFCLFFYFYEAWLPARIFSLVLWHEKGLQSNLLSYLNAKPSPRMEQDPRSEIEMNQR